MTARVPSPAANVAVAECPVVGQGTATSRRSRS